MQVQIGPYPKGEKERRIKIKIHPYDVWSLDHTLAIIIHPALVLLKEKKHGAPYVDDADVPIELRKSSFIGPMQNDWDTDLFHFDRWDWVLDEMIWAFDHILNDDWENEFHSGVVDHEFAPLDEVDNDGEPLYEWKQGPNHTFKIDIEGLKKMRDRIDNGTRLFGVYFTNLWD